MAYNYNINGNGQSIEQYNYDEFGIPCFYKDNEVIGLLTRSIQPLGLTDMKWMKWVDCILHKREDMMPELEDLSVKIS